jgi:adenylate cyclase
MGPVSGNVLRFGRCAVDLAGCALLRDEAVVPLRPKAFDVLRHLVENPGRLIAKEELIKAIWPDTFVTDDSLVQCIREVREAIGDADHRIVRTVPRRGYLFAAAVSGTAPPAEPRPARVPDDEAPPAPASAGAEPGPTPRRGPGLCRQFLVPGAALVLAAAGALLLWLRPPGPVAGVVAAPTAGRLSAVMAAQRQSIAVLPFLSLPGPGDAGDLAYGLTDDLISALGRFPEISVRAHGAVARYRDRPASPAEVGRDLDVRYVVEGSVRRAPDGVRISVRLAGAPDGAVRWADQYETQGTRLFGVQDEIVRRIAGSLALRLTGLEGARVTSRPPASLAAWELVLRARALLARVDRTANSEARSLLERAIAVDPAYVPAYVSLGLVEVNALANGWTHDAGAALDRLEALGRTAVALDAAHPGGHALLGRAHFRRGDHDRALDALSRAVALNPSDAETLTALGQALLWSGDIPGALRALEAVARYAWQPAPMDAFHLGTAYLLAGRHAEAIRTLERSVERHPAAPYTNAALAAAYAAAGRRDDGARQAEAVRRLAPRFRGADFGSRFRNPEHRAWIVAALGAAGL